MHFVDAGEEDGEPSSSSSSNDSDSNGSETGRGGASNPGGSSATENLAGGGEAGAGGVGAGGALAQGGTGGVEGNAGNTSGGQASVPGAAGASSQPTPGLRVSRRDPLEVFDAITELLGAERTLGLASCLDVEVPAGEAADEIYTAASLASAHALAEAAARRVREEALAVTGCTPELTETCAQAYVSTLAELAFQRPLSSDETSNLEQVFGEVLALGEGAESALEVAVQAVFVSPLFLYRFEEEAQ